jgi:hypothetical protein
MSENNSPFTLSQSSELNYQLIINATHNAMHYEQPHLQKVSFQASFPQAAHGVQVNPVSHHFNTNNININNSIDTSSSMVAASFPLEANAAKPHHMEGDIFFLFGLFCLFSVFMSMYYVFFAEQKTH